MGAHEVADHGIAFLPAPCGEHVVAEQQSTLKIDGPQELPEALMVAFGAELR
jgi:hypothetical protein